MISTNDFQHIGSIKTDLNKLKSWCYSQLPTMTNSVSNYTVGGRKEKWFDRGWKLSHPVEVFTAEHNERIYQLGQRLFPGNHACLFLYYPFSAYIKPHRDHTASENWVVQIHIGCPVTFTVGENEYALADGEIVGFNSKLLHSVSAARSDRFVISWRKIKPIYLQQQLSLL
ncbi:MAG: alpha-ketoglutarate-dependent dioxygenase AlkB [Hydrococcus sp. CRU_1_1]|nr:alpha-ketoglutarate-dependent dioxygenase AlkB [Hydrococcus sp. CRU_1_1]